MSNLHWTADRHISSSWRAFDHKSNGQDIFTSKMVIITQGSDFFLFNKKISNSIFIVKAWTTFRTVGTLIILALVLLNKRTFLAPMRLITKSAYISKLTRKHSIYTQTFLWCDWICHLQNIQTYTLELAYKYA